MSIMADKLREAAQKSNNSDLGQRITQSAQSQAASNPKPKQDKKPAKQKPQPK